MTELETLRKEVNELRERVALLERNQHFHPQPPPQVVPNTPPYPMPDWTKD